MRDPENPYPDLPLAYLKSVLDYDRHKGTLRWKKNRGRLARAGDDAGFIDHYGYVVLTVRGHRVQAHRLVWFMSTKRWPVGRLVAYGDKADLRLANWEEQAARVIQTPEARRRRQWYADTASRRKAEHEDAHPSLGQVLGLNGYAK